MRKFIEARKAAKTEGGFSLIDVVVTVAIIVALSVGGFVAYNGLIDSAKKAAVAGAADQVYTAVIVAENDTDPKTVPDSSVAGVPADAVGVVQSYNDSNTDITVTATKVGNEWSVTATNDAAPTITATRGAK